MRRSIAAITSMFFFLAPRVVYAQETSTAVTFSQVQCEYLGQDWKDIYLKTLDLGFDMVRLGAYWNRIEAKEGVYDFSELDWQIDRAEERKTLILLTVGMKAPRWPEFFIPGWLQERVKLRFGSDPSERGLLKEKLLEFMEKVVVRYRDRDIIVAWQVENEPLTRSGPRELRISREFLEREMALVRGLDTKNRPIVVNAMTYANGFLRFLARLAYKTNPVLDTLNIAQIPAINVYPVVGHKLLFKKVCFWSNIEGKMNYLRVFRERALRLKKDLWVTELQAEPWEPGELVHLGQEPALTCQPQSFVLTYRKLTEMGYTTIFFWGVEYWFYRAQKYGDKSWLKVLPVQGDLKKALARHQQRIKK